MPNSATPQAQGEEEAQVPRADELPGTAHRRLRRGLKERRSGGYRIQKGPPATGRDRTLSEELRAVTALVLRVETAATAAGIDPQPATGRALLLLGVGDLRRLSRGVAIKDLVGMTAEALPVENVLLAHETAV